MLASRSISRGLASLTRHFSTGAISLERQALKNSKRCVIKVGTAVVTRADGNMALSRIGALVEEIKELRNQGRQVLLVSSGAMGLGRSKLGFTKEHVSETKNVVDRQSCASAGQGVLQSMYHMMFKRMQLNSSQVLITQDDLQVRHRYQMLMDTLDKLAELGSVPIINENDVVTGGSWGTTPYFTDNDKLSAILAAGSDADGLALLTDVEGVFDKPPDQPGAKRIEVWTPDMSVTIGEKSTMGRGGMASKISAARVAANGGVQTCVASGYDLANISRIFNGENVGTLFPASERPNRRIRWLSLATGSEGTLIVADAFKEQWTNQPEREVALLLSQVVGIHGSFEKKAVVSLRDSDGVELGRGIVQQDSFEIKDKMLEHPKDPFELQHASWATAHIVVRGIDMLLLEAKPVLEKAASAPA